MPIATSGRRTRVYFAVIALVGVSAALLALRPNRTYRLFDFSSASARLANGSEVTVQIRGEYRDVDSAGVRWIERGRPYYLHVAIRNPDSALARPSGIALDVVGLDSLPALSVATTALVPQLDTTPAVGTAFEDLGITFQDYTIVGVITFGDGAQRTTESFSVRISKKYETVRTNAFLEFLRGG